MNRRNFLTSLAGAAAGVALAPLLPKVPEVTTEMPCLAGGPVMTIKESCAALALPPVQGSILVTRNLLEDSAVPIGDIVQRLAAEAYAQGQGELLARAHL